MTAKATPLRIPTPGTYLGEFHIRRFNIVRDDERREYERIRTAANRPGSGLVIENIRDLQEVSEFTEGENRIRTETWFLVVSWWEKPETRKAPKDPPQPENGFYIERRVSPIRQEAFDDEEDGPM